MPPSDGAEGGVPLRLTAAERALLRKMCARYRRTIPVYLQAGRAELAVLDSILARLDEAEEG